MSSKRRRAALLVVDWKFLFFSPCALHGAFWAQCSGALLAERSDIRRLSPSLRQTAIPRRWNISPYPRILPEFLAQGRPPAPLHGGEDAAQDIDLFLIEPYAIEQTTQTPHEVLRIVRIEKLQFHEHLFKVALKQFALLKGGERRAVRRHHRTLLCRHAQFIRDHLHGRGEIERGIVEINRDVQQVIAAVELFVAEPRVLATEHNRDRTLRRGSERTLRRPPRIARRPRYAAAARGGAKHQAASGPRRVADVAGMGGLHQDNTDLFQHCVLLPSNMDLPSLRLVCYPTRFCAPVHSEAQQVPPSCSPYSTSPSPPPARPAPSSSAPWSASTP